MRDLYLQIEPSGSHLEIASVGLQLRGGIVNVDGHLKRKVESAPVWTEILDAVVESLRENGQLLAVRPEVVEEYQEGEAEYAYEFVKATRVHLPVEDRLVVEGFPPELTVWVADPPTRTEEPRDHWDLFGSYLFLVEEGDAEPGVPSRYYLSGISALAAIVRAAHGEIDPDALRELGRGASTHPIEKLVDLGATVSVEREIETLYQIRYMTDEQGGWTVSEGRVNDLMAYPLAILASRA